jgi:glycosyltransferase involved in cell wall biosynthesis
VKILLVTNFASHYRAPLFERLQKQLDIEFIFFTAGTEEYWQKHLGVTDAAIRSQTLTGREVLPKLRLNPDLVRELWRRDYDILVKCINGRLELPFAYMIARLRRKPFILWASLWRHPTTPFHRLTKRLVDHIYRQSDAIICDGPHIADFLIREGVEAEKVFVAELAVDNEFFSQPVSAGEVAAVRASMDARERPIVLSVSRLVEQKGLDHLIAAVAGLGDLDPILVVVGTGELQDRLEAQASRSGVDLQLLGGLPPSQMPALYASADAVVMASVTTALVTEVWGLALNEAMCQGKPVIATTAVGAAAGGLVRNEETGLVVPEGDAQALEHALRRILSSPKLAHDLGEAGRRRVVATNYDAMVDAYRAAITLATARAERDGRLPPIGQRNELPQQVSGDANLRVLVSHVRYLQPGGEDHVFRTEVELLRGSSMEVHALELSSGDFERVSRLERLQLGLSYRDHRYGRRLIRRHIDELTPDVIHFHNPMPLLGPGAMLEADEAGCATVQTLHNYRLSCLAGTHVLHGKPCELCRPGHYAYGILNRCYRASVMQSLLAADATSALWENFVRRRVPTVAIALNEYMKEKYVAFGADPGRMVVKPNSVDDGEATRGERKGVLLAGRLSPEKGILDLLGVWPEEAPLLTVAGSGPLERDVMSRVRENVCYVGQLEEPEMRRMMLSALVVVVPALSPAPDTLIAMEALAEGTPLVAFDSGPMGEITKEIQPGLSVNPGDFEALVQTAIEIAESDDWDDASRRCRDLHEQRYSHAANLKSLENAYRRAIVVKRG